MGGSSSNTPNTSGKDKDKDSPAAFLEGDRVLAYHGPLLYEAKVQKTENRENEWRYFVHYLGWNKNEIARATSICQYGRRCTQQTTAEIAGHSQVSAEESESVLPIFVRWWF